MENVSPLEQEIMTLRQELAAKNNSLQEKNNHIKILEEYILSLKQKQFGSSSEKLSPTQTELFDEADDNAELLDVDVVLQNRFELHKINLNCDKIVLNLTSVLS